MYVCMYVCICMYSMVCRLACCSANIYICIYVYNIMVTTNIYTVLHTVDYNIVAVTIMRTIMVSVNIIYVCCWQDRTPHSPSSSYGDPRKEHIHHVHRRTLIHDNGMYVYIYAYMNLYTVFIYKCVCMYVQLCLYMYVQWCVPFHMYVPHHLCVCMYVQQQ